MIYNFDEVIDRKNTGSSKWDNVGAKVGNPDALPMWVADTDFRCPKPVIDAIQKRVEHGIFGYPFIDTDFASVTKQWLAKRHSWDIDPSWVVFCAGIVPSLNTLVQTFTLPGDEVIIQRPVYYPFTHAVVDNNRVVSSNSLVLKDGRYEIDFEDLEQRAKSPKAKLMILCSPHNPVSRVFSKEELTRIGEICIENNVILVSDEIHNDIIFNGHKHTPMAAISEKIANITITAIAPSKTFNTAGLRASALIISNAELRKKLADQFVKNKTAITNVFGLLAYVAAYEHGEEYLEQLLPYLETNVKYVDEYLKTKMPKIKLIYPEGTYLLWFDCRDLGLDKDALDDFIINKALVAMDRGHWFGEEGTGFMRLNIACPQSIITQALDQIYAEYIKL